MRDINTLLNIPTPSYVLEEAKLHKNLAILDTIQSKSQAKILLALKGYAFWRCFKSLKHILKGSTASGLYEARLGAESIGGRECNKDICVFSPAFKHSEFGEILDVATHIIFNSFAQWQHFKPLIDIKNKTLQRLAYPPIEVGLRVNPLYSEVDVLIYNPCAIGSRLGITPTNFEKGVKKYGLDGVSGLHFHTLCEQDSNVLKRTLAHFEQHFSQYIKDRKWINFGGGHHITRNDYDRDMLINLIVDFKQRYNNIDVILEPGEAVGWQVGFLIGEVLDIVENDGLIAIVDVSAAAHMPDCLEMPYRPNVSKISSHNIESDKGKNQGTYCYVLAGATCLAGDVIGDYSFETPLNIGDKIIFEDMLHYTIVKNNTFNGIALPSLSVINTEGQWQLLKAFDYSDYKERN